MFAVLRDHSISLDRVISSNAAVFWRKLGDLSLRLCPIQDWYWYFSLNVTLKMSHFPVQLSVRKSFSLLLQHLCILHKEHLCDLGQKWGIIFSTSMCRRRTENKNTSPWLPSWDFLFSVKKKKNQVLLLITTPSHNHNNCYCIVITHLLTFAFHVKWN